MPNRFLKESICTSENIDRLTDFQEIFFYRLIVNCDDFGRFDARPKLLASRLFPLREVSTDEVNEALAALQRADLITLYAVDNHPYLFMNSWEKHQQKRSDKSRYPEPPVNGCDQMITDDNGCYQMISDDNNCDQPKADDNKCPRIRNTYSNNDIRNTITDTARACARETAVAADEELIRINGEQERVLTAAEDAGFLRSNSVRAKLIALYADHGLEKMLAAIASCVQHGVVNLAYLEGALKGEPKKNTGQKIPAQDYEQRDYSDEQNAAMDRLMAWKKKKEASGA